MLLTGVPASPRLDQSFPLEDRVVFLSALFDRRCSGLRMKQVRLANRSIARPTLSANKKDSWPTISANGPAISANGWRGDRALISQPLSRSQCLLVHEPVCKPFAPKCWPICTECWPASVRIRTKRWPEYALVCKPEVYCSQAATPRPSLLPVPSSSNPDKWYGEAALHCHPWPGADRYHGQRDVG
jgi:hypothetical protein